MTPKFAGILCLANARISNTARYHWRRPVFSTGAADFSGEDS
jgi:hypothetical protein